MNIAVVGAGHAGVEAAATAAKTGAAVTIFSRETILPYFRPRLVAVAFGQAEPGSILMHPAEWYGRNNIDLRLETEVTAVHAGVRTLCTRARGVESTTPAYDGIVIAAGAAAIVPAFPGSGGEALLPLWQCADAVEIRRRIRPGARLALIGGGLIGVEAAVRAAQAGLRVTIIEKAPRLMAANLGDMAARLLESLLEKKGVRVLAGVCVSKVDSGEGTHALTLENGDRIEFDLGIVSVGARANLDFMKDAGIVTARGITADPRLKTSVSGIYACGDIAQLGDAIRCSAPRASAQGRIAGGNVCAAVAGDAQQDYVAGPEPVFLKCGDIEVHAFGAVADLRAPDCSESPVEPITENSCRIRVTRNGKPAGVQMIGTKADFDKMVREIR